jgi:3-oxoacyl-[acyl-carrier-protein] synthase II
MSSTHDSAGRPIVVVTGMGVVTSLGSGKTDNWARLTAGQSGIRSITRFATDGLKTRIAGTVDFVPLEPFSTPALSERLAETVAEEAIAESGIGRRGDFPGPLFLAVPPIEVEWPQRRELAQASGSNDQVSYDDILRACAKMIPFNCARSPVWWDHQETQCCQRVGSPPHLGRRVRFDIIRYITV